MDRIYAEIDRLKEKYLRFWVEICNIESPTNNKAGVDAVARFAAQKAEELGWQAEFFRHDVSGDCVCITMNADAIKAPVALSGHMDTVHPIGLFGTPATRIEGDKIYGPGVVDCKGGIVASFLAMEALQECGYIDRPIKLLLQSDEEVGSFLSQKATINYIIDRARDCVAFLNTEGSDLDSLTVGRKGILRYQFEITGRAVHSSKCYEGASAICEAAHKIIELEKWKETDGITCNCGVIEGGTTPNTVAEKCTFLADFRYKTREQQALVQKRVQEIADHATIEGTTCRLTQKSFRVPMEKTEKTMALLEKINGIFQDAGLPTVIAKERTGGSDAADVSAAGIPAIDSIGVYGKEIHSVREYAFTDSLAISAKRMAAIIKKID